MNEERVGYRKREIKLKMRKQKNKLELIQQQKRDLEERLAVLKQSVAVCVERYQESNIHALIITQYFTRDWKRATGLTTSFENYIKPIENDSAKDWSWNNIPGFSSDTILKDSRMQLSIALFKSGLGSSKYANDVLNSMRPAVKRPDQISQFKFGSTNSK